MRAQRGKRLIPKTLKALLVSFLSLLGLCALRLLPSTIAEGWRPAVTLVIVLGLIAVALVNSVRAR